jgi:hypothetical protein
LNDIKGIIKMTKENNIQEISIDEMEQVNGSVVEPVTLIVCGVIVAVAAVGTLGVMIYNQGYQDGKDRAARDNNH